MHAVCATSIIKAQRTYWVVIQKKEDDPFSVMKAIHLKFIVMWRKWYRRAVSMDLMQVMWSSTRLERKATADS